MGIGKIIGRFILYGGIATSISTPIAYKAGHKAASADLNQINGSHLERIAEDQFKVTNPDNNKKYLINFGDKSIDLYSNPASEIKPLEDIFSE
jgi:hypothetical protein